MSSDQEHTLPTRAWTVAHDQNAIRLDAFVRLCLPHLSLREAQRAIGQKAFWIHDRPGKKGDRLVGGDAVVFKGAPHWLRPTPSPKADFKVSILYEDPSVLVVDKPAGMPTHGLSGRHTETLANWLVAMRPSLSSVGGSRWEPGLVHRLDQETSGAILAAKDQASFESLRSQFRRGLIRKKYWALVWGRTPKQGVIDRALARNPGYRKKMVVVQGTSGRSKRIKKWKAVTRFQLLAYARGFSLLEVEMKTGVTHQVRLHLASVGHPVVGDPLYGGERSASPALGRHFLHAFYLKFRHPMSSRALVIQSPLPEELRSVLERLGIKPPCS